MLRAGRPTRGKRFLSPKRSDRLWGTEQPLNQGRIKLFGAPRQWKHFRPLFQAVFLSGGGGGGGREATVWVTASVWGAKFPGRYGTLGLINLITRSCSWLCILSRMYPVHIITPYFCKIHLNIFLSRFDFSSRPFPLRLSDRNVKCISHPYYACYVPHPSRFRSYITSNYLRRH